MGISLNGLTPANTYQSLIKVGDNSQLTATLKTLSDGFGTDLPMEVSTSGVNFTGTLTQNGSPITTTPSGVAGAIQFSDGSAFASDATNLFWDDTNNRLGVGTNAPFSLLTVAGQSSFYSVQSAGVGSDFFYSDINPDITAGADNQVVSLLRLRDRGQGNTGGFTGTQRLSVLMENTGGGQYPFQLFSETGSLRIGYQAIATPTAQLEIQGAGTTSATTSLLVQNSAGSDLIRLNDLGLLQFGGTTNAFPAFKRVGSGLELKSADDTSDGEPIFTSFNIQVKNMFFGAGALTFGYAGGTVGFRMSNVGASSFGVSVTDAPASAQLEVRSTTKGFLPPRMTTTQKNAISSPASGLQVYDTDLNQMSYYNGTTWVNI
jgi:hypothetical protein